MRKSNKIILVILLLLFIVSFITLVNRKAVVALIEVNYYDQKKEQIIGQMSEDTIEIEIPDDPIEIEIPDDQMPFGEVETQ
ncbi:hypothetical protein KPL39_13000 [Clostridium gasigenes]|uniref:hypothetical protein n=1 Tax=Clostridium gasigenes TaxID=94869 RepID=UPI001C0B77E6|nr:hypothetical protein [Clostridium gasigenes]MBU3137184.1 hypothetical protein [Clostridium gasigenes]